MGMSNFKLLSILLSFLILSAPLTVMGADTKLYYRDFSNLAIDGVIGSDEYATSFEVSHYADGSVFLTVSWSHNSTHIAIGLEGKLTGFIGFGMNDPGKGMAGADMVIVSVENNVATAGDYYSTGNIAPTLDDDQFPMEVAGKEENGVTTVEVVFPLTSEDAAGQDHNWKVGGTYGFFFAAHETSDELVYHTWHSKLYTVEIASDSETPNQHTVILGESTSGNENSGDYVAPVLFWGFLIAISFVIWRNGKFY